MKMILPIIVVIFLVGVLIGSYYGSDKKPKEIVSTWPINKIETKTQTTSPIKNEAPVLIGSWLIQMDITKEQFLQLIPSDLSDMFDRVKFGQLLPSWNFATFQDSLNWLHLFHKDDQFFENKEEILFYKIWSDYFFQTNYTQEVNTTFLSCLLWKSSSTLIQDGFLRNICEGIPGSNNDEKEDFSILKQKFLKYPELVSSKKDIVITDLQDYFLSKIVKNNYDEKMIAKDYFLYVKALELWKCEYIDDQQLLQLCMQWKKR